MNKRNLKLIMELIFIFIVPLLILCINCNYSNTIEYDNNGNYQATEKHIEFTAPFDYTKNQEEYIEQENWDNIDNENYIYFPSTLTNPTIIGSSEDHGDYFYLVYDNGTLYDIYNDIPSISGGSVQINGTIENIELKDNYYKYDVNEIYIRCDEYYVNYYILENVSITTIWGQLKNLIVENLQLQDNVIIDIIISYTILWFTMFVIWHFFYWFFDGIVHLFVDWVDKGKKSD